MKHSKAVEVLAALAQDTRLSIFLLLLDSSDDGICAGEIAEKLEIPPTTLSFHLSQLKSCGLIEGVKEGRSIIYKASRKRAKRLAGYITGKS